ncbi:hypothetical protein [Piscirickettsia litoralis]|uniref:Uncharacterized protein n=1 Tax=Piscirickettsia litoralis TaxID=1891921 RepID=A0ABX3A2G5_9GAMM|nr:hypothetical protein [Piscirickettsia litoralis]ODN41570.1 hypothetical protein BGC07_15800 [Piscirickettsia litoralis]
MDKIQKGFLDRAEGAVIDVVRDDGINKHIQCIIKEGRMIFEIITWGDTLCINSIIGSYTFRCDLDMIEKFRKDNMPEVNPRSWVFIVSSAPVIDNSACLPRELDHEKLEAALKKQVYSSGHTEEEKNKIWGEVETQILERATDLNDTRNLIAYFDSPFGFKFEENSEVYDVSISSYSYEYLWCLYAIQFAITKYDDAKAQIAHGLEKMYH